MIAARGCWGDFGHPSGIRIGFLAKISPFFVYEICIYYPIS